jgi:hypothetical protein
MEMGKNFVVLLVALAAAVLVFMLLPGTNFSPYKKPKGYGNFESFKGNASSTGASVLVGAGSSPVDVLSDFSSSTEDLTKNMMSSFGASASGQEGFATDSSTPEPATERIRSLQWGTPGDPQLIDQFGQVKSNGQDGVNGCVSSGLSNSGGHLCLSPDLINLLSTRGGNATGR